MTFVSPVFLYFTEKRKWFYGRYTHIFVFFYIYIYTYIYIYIYTHIFIFIYTHILFIYTHIYIYLYIHIYLYIYTCLSYFVTLLPDPGDAGLVVDLSPLVSRWSRYRRESRSLDHSILSCLQANLPLILYYIYVVVHIYIYYFKWWIYRNANI